jgi:hypothetical protein
MTDPTSTRLPSRGTIIVDASALLALCGKVHPSFKADGIKPERYLDILTFLANKGYRIVIPEIVAIQAAGTLASGADIGAIFPNARKLRGYEILKSFLRDVVSYASDAVPPCGSMEIISNTGPQEVDDYCAALKDALNHSDISQRPKNGIRVEKNTTRRDLIEQIHRNTNKSQFGDKAIRALVADTSHFPASEPITVLADDKNLRLSMHARPQTIPTCTSSGLVCRMHLAGLSPYIGLMQSVPLASLRKNMFDGNISSKKNPEESTELKLHMISQYQSGYFYQSLQQLTKDLARQQASAPAPEEEIRGPRSARFAIKFPRTPASNHAANAQASPPNNDGSPAR